MDQPTGIAVMDPSVAELHQKLDLLTTQVLYLTEQAQRAERAGQERAELMHDAMPIVNDVFRISVEQLEEVQEYVDLADLLRLVKRLLRNGRNIEKMLDQLESIMDLVQTVGPLSDEAFGKAADLLQTAEHKGYFRFAQGGARRILAVAAGGAEGQQQLDDLAIGEGVNALVQKFVAQPLPVAGPLVLPIAPVHGQPEWP